MLLLNNQIAGDQRRNYKQYSVLDIKSKAVGIFFLLERVQAENHSFKGFSVPVNSNVTKIIISWNSDLRVFTQ